ncbi:MAG TPA: hypothetical protein VFI42_00660 [Thermomicrobiaceae bacterium]|nr:hypothetical protein [Thermomicrobiaceae bacterium]
MESTNQERNGDVAATQRHGANAQRARDVDAKKEPSFGIDEKAGDSGWDWRSFRASAFDEMDVLRVAGLQGWELVDVGILALNCRRPTRREDATQWEYARRVNIDRQGVLQTMTELGWEPAGLWFPFMYFKRNTNKPV